MDPNTQELLMGASGSSVPSDVDFENTVLLLHGDGTNGAQNNTFIDGSTNNFTITRNGNTTQGTFSPFGDRWSNYFDGSGDYLSIPNSASLSPGTGNFTVETFVVFNGLPGTSGFAPLGQNDAIGGSTDDKFYFALYNDAGTYKLRLGRHNTPFASSVDWTPSVGVWYHLAACRQSGTTLLFINGVQQSVTNNTIFNGVNLTQSGFSIGGMSSPFYLNGYLSNFRYVVGTALYTSSFTQPTAPLTAVTNTSLLTCQSNRFVDNSTNNFTITRNGDVRVEKFNPFGRSATYNSSIDGGSGYFDGSGDSISTPSNAAFNLSSDFSIECWVYFNGSSPSGGGVSGELLGASSAGGAVICVRSGTLFALSTNATADDLTASFTFATGTWYHLVACRTGSTACLFINGTRVATGTVTRNYSQSAFVVFSGLNGYISDFRVIKGSNPYGTGSTLSVPTAPLTAISNTSLLLNFTNAGVIDNTGLNVLETVDNAQIDTSIKKFGTGSLEFDGNGDYLILPRSENFNLSTGDFTIEGWLNVPSVNSTYRCIFSIGAPVQIYSRSGTIEVYFGSDDGNSYFVNPALGPSNSIAVDTWAHFAVTRSGSTFRAFVNGVAGTSVTSSTAVFFSSTSPTVGTYGPQPTLYPYTGFIDDLRITKGIARYTANFTPPTAPFPDF